MKSPDPGKLDQRVTFQRLTQVADGLGGSTQSWADLFTCWAQVEPMRGGERLMAEQLEDPRDYRVTVRRSGDSAGVTAADRVSWRGSLLNVRFIADAGPRPLYLTFECERGVTT